MLDDFRGLLIRRVIRPFVLISVLVLIAIDPVKSDSKRSQSELRRNITALNSFGIDLLSQLHNQSKNLAISPLSIFYVTSMMRAGADGTTLKSIDKALGLDGISDNHLGDSLKIISDNLNSSLSSRTEEAKSFDWRIANRIFADKNYSLRADFKATLTHSFNSLLHPLDFKSYPDRERSFINSWVEEQTKDRIKDLIPPGGISTDTAICLVNALYLKAQWETPFSDRLTEDRAFKLEDGSRIKVKTMQRTANFRYLADEQATLVGIPYLARDLWFYIVLPNDDSSLTKVLSQRETIFFDPAKFSKVEKIKLTVPKFKLSSPSLSLRESFVNLGLGSIFNIPQGSANFNRLISEPNQDSVLVKDIYHKTFLEIDENGTEAAAATAMTSERMMAPVKPKEPIEVNVDRPFLFYLREERSDAVLFVGQVRDPRSE